MKVSPNYLTLYKTLVVIYKCNKKGKIIIILLKDINYGLCRLVAEIGDGATSS